MANTTKANPNALRSAAQALVDWQQSVSDQKYADIVKRPRPEQAARFYGQAEIVSSLLDSSDSYLRKLKKQAGPELADEALDAVPLIGQRIQSHELANPNWATDKCIHESLVSQGWNRGDASNYGNWHVVTLRQMRDGVFANPPSFLLHKGYTGQLPVNRGILDRDFDHTSSGDRKSLDAAIRNLLRHSGGIFHRKGQFLINAALPAAWWRVEISSAAAQTDCGLSDEQIYGALQPVWSNWAAKAAYSSTRLAAPSTAAAFALVAHEHRSANGDWPKGKTADEIIAKLMRRTLHLSVSHVTPEDLAGLVN